MSFPDIGATGIIAAVILAFGVIGFIKGLIRTILAMVCLGIAGYAALWGHEHASDLTSPWLTNPGPWMPKFIAIATGLIVFFICRYLLHFLVNPFNESKTGKKIGFGIPAAILSLCTGLVILWTAFTGIRYAGSLAELRHTRLTLSDQNKNAESHTLPLLATAKRSLDASIPGQIQRNTDPFYTPLKVELCQLLILYHHGPTRQKMLADRSIRSLLNDPQFIELAYLEEILHAAQAGQPRELFQSSGIDPFLQQTSQSQLLKALEKGQLNAFIPSAG